MQNLAAMELHISIASGELFNIGGFSVTNAFATGVLGGLITLLVLFYVGGKVRRG